MISNQILKEIKLFFLLFSFSFIVFAQTNEDKTTEKLKPYRFIFSVNLFQNISTEDVLASSKILANQIAKKRNIKGEVDIIVYNTEKELIEATKTEFDFILISPVDLLTLKKYGNIKPTLVNMTQGLYGNIYYLITNKTDNINSLKDLSKENIKLLARSNGQVPFLWLDKLLRDYKLPPKEKFFRTISFDHKPTNVLLPVFFNKITSAIITKTSYELLCELNPQISKQIKILEVSDPLLFGVICFDPRNKNTEREKLLLDILLSLQNDKNGKQLFELFNVDKLILYKDEYWQSFIKLYR